MSKERKFGPVVSMELSLRPGYPDSCSLWRRLEGIKLMHTRTLTLTHSGWKTRNKTNEVHNGRALVLSSRFCR